MKTLYYVVLMVLSKFGMVFMSLRSFVVKWVKMGIIYVYLQSTIPKCQLGDVIEWKCYL
jgi:hypothetical protein